MLNFNWKNNFEASIAEAMSLSLEGDYLHWTKTGDPSSQSHWLPTLDIPRKSVTSKHRKKISPQGYFDKGRVFLFKVFDVKSFDITTIQKRRVYIITELNNLMFLYHLIKIRCVPSSKGSQLVKNFLKRRITTFNEVHIMSSKL